MSSERANMTAPNPTQPSSYRRRID